MSEKINEEESNNDMFQHFSGISGDLFEKLPKPDKRPYIIIGFFSFCILIFFGALVFLITVYFTGNTILSLGAGILAIYLLNKLNKIVFSRLIHRSDITHKFIFWGYGITISFLFFIFLSVGFYSSGGEMYYNNYNTESAADSTITTDTIFGTPTDTIFGTEDKTIDTLPIYDKIKK